MGSIKTKTGSAILIVMLLSTALAAVALTVGYLAMAEVSMETNSEDGSMAYMAAEAGIEDGLLRYRYDNNVEVGSFDIASPSVERIDIAETANTGRTLNINPLNNPPSDSLRQYYDLRIKYKDDLDDLTQAIDFDNDKSLAKDMKLTLGGFDQITDVTIKYSSEQLGCVLASKNCFLQLKGTNIGGGGIEFSDYTSGSTVEKKVTVDPNKILEIKAWGMNISYKIMAEDSSGNRIKLDTGETTIESTGYYGSAKRQLKARVDRKSGKLLEIFDFVLNSSNGNIQ